MNRSLERANNRLQRTRAALCSLPRPSPLNRVLGGRNRLPRVTSTVAGGASRAVFAACALALLIQCRQEPLPPVRPVGTRVASDLQPFLDMNITLSPAARAEVRATLEGFFAEKGRPTRVEHTVLAGIPDQSGTWPLLLYVCVHEAHPPTPQATDHVVTLTGTAIGHRYDVADLFGDTPVIMEPALFNAAFPDPLRRQMLACLKSSAPTPNSD